MKIDLNKPNELTLDNVRRLLASGDDRSHSQLRVSEAGIAYLSEYIGSERTDGLAFRLETFAARKGYVGTAASQDDEWVSRILEVLRKNWPNPASEYIDEF
jgi:hypothetical protein